MTDETENAAPATSASALDWDASRKPAVAARARSREGEDALADAVAATADPEAELVREELRASVRAAIAALDDASAQAIRALLGEGPPAHVAPAALRKRISRAYARLRVLLGGRS